MAQPLISVIIPCHDSAQYVGKAIEAALAQTYRNLEIIIVDDHSADNLDRVVAPYLAAHPAIRYVKNPYDDPDRVAPNGVNINAGWQAKNYGMEIARGEIFTFQDADDGSCSNRIEFLHDAMRKYNVMFISCGWQQYRDEYNGKKLDWQLTESDLIATPEILRLAKKTKPILFKHPFVKDERNKNFVEKILRRINREYLLDWTPYPGASGSFLLKKEVFAKCRFRQLYERARPSKAGRGKDRDLAFWIAETFKSSLVVKVPLYLWRQKNQNADYLDEKYRPK
ncbi:MAG TPA: glycosyltransferase family A protein [Candidatus Nanoarchaeia archaeon]|nr:glycosyltransferase family A protein [Candidatus Nanoarchaeia archaeon]